VATVAFLAGLRAFSTLVFEPLIATNAVTYGAVGTVLIVQSWLIGVGWVIYGGQLFGRWFHDGWLRSWADSRRGRGEPGCGEEGEPTPGGQSTPPRELGGRDRVVPGQAVYAAIKSGIERGGRTVR
jgi:membrane protein